VLPRIVSGLVALLLVGAMVTGCSGQPAPEPSTPSAPTFASDEEAFAAAEETYRAYVDALNQVDLSDPATFEPVFAWTTGELNASDRKGLTRYHAEEVALSGTSKVTLVQPANRSPNSLDIAVCLDVSQIELIGADGASLVDLDRVDVQTITVTLEEALSSPTGFLVSAIGPRDGHPACE
jgi:hypothetical protein